MKFFLVLVGLTYFPVPSETSRTQYPKVPKVTEELRWVVALVRVTLKMEMSLTTGAEIVVMSSRMAEIKRRRVPQWWMIPVTAILSFSRLDWVVNGDG